MKVTLSIDSQQSIEINYSDLAHFANWMDDDVCYSVFFSRLAAHPSSEVRCAMAGKYFLPSEMLEQLARDMSIEVVRRVANNNHALGLLDLSLLQEMIQRDVSVASDISENLSVHSPNVRDALIGTLLKHSDPKVVEAVENFVRDEQ